MIQTRRDRRFVVPRGEEDSGAIVEPSSSADARVFLPEPWPRETDRDGVALPLEMHSASLPKAFACGSHYPPWMSPQFEGGAGKTCSELASGHLAKGDTPPAQGANRQSGFRLVPPRPSVIRRILLIECDGTAAEEYRRVLAACAEVEHVPTPDDAEPLLLREGASRFVLRTHAKHVHDGFRFLLRWRALDLVSRRCVVLVGGTDDPKEVVFAIQQGILQHIPDPCPPQQLLRKVRRLLAWA